MIKKFFDTLKHSKLALGVFIVMLVLLIPICLISILFGIPVFIPIIIVLAVAFVFVPIIGVAGQGVSQAVSLKDNKGKLEQTEREAPELAELERERGDLQKKNIFFYAAVIILALLMSMIAPPLFIIVLVAGVIVYFSWLNKLNKAFEDSFKQRVVLAQLKAEFENVSFEPDKSIEETQIRRVSPITFNNANGDDLIEADRNGLHFCRCDVRLSVERQEVDDDGDTSTRSETVFTGALLRVSSEKNYPQAVQVCPKSFQHKAADNVETESIAFEEKMNVYAEDQLGARVVLTPQLMEALMALEQTAGQAFSVTFCDSYIYFFLRSPEGNSFEVDLKKGVSVMALRDAMAQQIKTLCTFLDAVGEIKRQGII